MCFGFGGLGFEASRVEGYVYGIRVRGFWGGSCKWCGHAGFNCSGGCCFLSVIR